jgi:hypothetical protein
MKDSVRRKIKQAIKREWQIASTAYNGRTEDSVIEGLLDEIDEILKAEGYPHIDFSQGKRPIIKEGNYINVDSLGADRKARELPQ